MARKVLNRKELRAEAEAAEKAGTKPAKTKKVAVKKVARGVQPKVEDDSRIASLEAKIEALTAALAVHMQSALPTDANFVSIEDINVPF